MKLSQPTYSGTGTWEYYRRNSSYHTSTLYHEVANFVATANTIYAIPFITIRPMIMSKMAIEVLIGHASNAKLGIYKTTLGASPQAFVAGSLDIDCTAAGLKEIAIAIPQLDLNSKYLLVVWFAGTPTIQGNSAAHSPSYDASELNPNNVYTSRQRILAYGGWPNPLEANTYGLGITPKVWIFGGNA
jgi:hypothetical protein